MWLGVRRPSPAGVSGPHRNMLSALTDGSGLLRDIREHRHGSKPRLGANRARPWLLSANAGRIRHVLLAGLLRSLALGRDKPLEKPPASE